MRADERRARAIVAERSGGTCEVRIPRVCLGRATNFQHRKNRSQGGEYSAANGLHVCGSGTTGCHGYIHAHPAESYAEGWSVRSGQDPGREPVRLWHGVVVLDESGGWTNLGINPPAEEHRADCSFWTSDRCDLDCPDIGFPLPASTSDLRSEGVDDA